MTWTETSIARALARQTFGSQHLVVLPNCIWTGNECDLLVVTPNLRIIDVEIKISRADLKADRDKDKWWHRQGWGEYQLINGRRTHVPAPKTAREWPPKVWKHYYAMPRAIWNSELMESLASTASGVILLGGPHHPDLNMASVERRAKPNPDAKPISAAGVADIARLASLRMWDSFREIERMKSDERSRRAAAALADTASIAKC